MWTISESGYGALDVQGVPPTPSILRKVSERNELSLDLGLL
jgi:hypothetical protein